eukprot:UN05937
MKYGNFFADVANFPSNSRYVKIHLGGVGSNVFTVEQTLFTDD